MYIFKKYNLELKEGYSNIPKNHCQQPSWIKKNISWMQTSYKKDSLATMNDTTEVLLIDYPVLA